MKVLKVGFLISIFALFFAQSSDAQDQGNRKIQFTINTGIAVPAAPQNFINYWNIGPGGGVGFDYELNPTVTLQLYGSYHRFGFNKDGFRDDLNLDSNVSVDGGSAEVGTIMGNVILHYATVNPAITPYFKIGAGFFRSVRSDIDFQSGTEQVTVNSDTEATFGANSAVGINYAVKSNLSLFIEIKYTTAFFEDGRTQYLPMNIGISF
jgi:outer membrane autotransporter protein